MAETTNPPTKLPVHPELFSCTRLSARLTVKACGARFLRVRAATKGSQDYDSSCDQCPVGAHHAKHGTLCPDTHAQTPTATPATTTTSTTTTKEKTTMGAQSDYTDGQKRDAVKQVLVDGKKLGEVAKALGFTDTTLRNWVKRFGHEVAGDAMDAAAGKEPKAKAPKQVKAPAPKATAKRAAKVAEDAPPATLSSAAVGVALAPLDRTTLGELGVELSNAVRFIGDERARYVVADAAWALTQASNG